MSALIPEGLEPLAVWDARDLLNCQPDVPRWLESTEWAKAHIERVDDAYRVEFHRLEIGDRTAPFAVVHRYKRNADGHKFAQEPGGDPVAEEPVVQPLDELPPAHLLESR